jgi:hypothetical protein
MRSRSNTGYLFQVLIIMVLETLKSLGSVECQFVEAFFIPDEQDLTLLDHPLPNIERELLIDMDIDPAYPAISCVSTIREGGVADRHGQRSRPS